MICALVQARTTSKRFPNKVLKHILGKPMIWHINERLKVSKELQDIIYVIPKSRHNDHLYQYLKKINVKIFRGNEKDIVDRYYKAAKKYKIDTIVRITADDPFKDPKVIDKCIKIFKKNNDVDYVSNCSYDSSIKATYPEGLEVEILTFKCLEKIWKNSKKESEREHLTPFIFNNSNKFKIKGVYSKKNLSDYRLTVDYKSDMEFAIKIYEALYNKNKIFLLNTIIKFLNSNKDILNLMNKFQRYEGYQISLNKDK